ncbi:MAG: YbhB/YbcL family Raf kinase inhibitor-like protein [Candidatus Omnitrophota bacterium]|jgi:Raf kinase inhibitor-like YbhB/YbcL family protein
MKRLTIVLFAWVVFAAYVCCAEEGGGNMKLISPAFEHNQSIPSKYTCQGEDVNPALAIGDIPEGTKSLALIVDDPDAPMGTWVHWVVYDIAPTSRVIDENSIPGTQGINDFRKKEYGGPCPPSGTHRYFFKVYALDTQLNLKEGITKKDLEKAMQAHILENAELIGLYKRH